MPPAILLYAIPFFIILMLLEIWYTNKEHKFMHEAKDTWAGVALGFGNFGIGILTKFATGGLYFLLYQYRIFDLDASAWWYWVVLFFAEDFTYYWFHRESHNIRFLWASHAVHHSSQKYNLAAAVRQTWTSIAGSFVFWLWLPLVGFHPFSIILFQQISLIYQYWIHTETINKMPRPIELVFNTPSHHRVHHGSDIKYLDRNHAGVLIIWDRFFGSFQPEEERPTYGLTKNVNTFNPIKIAFHEWVNLFRDVRKSKSFADVIKYLTKPPGWSPDGSTLTANEMRKKAKQSAEV
jgi:sterol desaturase/sphingolipid hydroxylase (fatty acid hydroxylase superfamily)